MTKKKSIAPVDNTLNNKINCTYMEPKDFINCTYSFSGKKSTNIKDVLDYVDKFLIECFKYPSKNNFTSITKSIFKKYVSKDTPWSFSVYFDDKYPNVLRFKIFATRTSFIKFTKIYDINVYESNINQYESEIKIAISNYKHLYELLSLD